MEKKHVEVQNAEAVQMLRDMCVRPDQHMKHPKRYSNSIIMSLGRLICSGGRSQGSRDLLVQSSLIRVPVFGFRTPSVETPHMTKLYDMMVSYDCTRISRLQC